MLKILASRLTSQVTEYEWNNLLSCVDKKKQDQINSFVKWEDAQRSLLAEIMIRLYVIKTLKMPNEDIQFMHNDYGKPFLKNIAEFHFNISHSEDWIVCSIHHGPVGIDIEKIVPFNLEIAKQLFSEIEYMDLLEKDEKERLSYFFELWTAKESYVKAVGKGLSIPLNSFSLKKYSSEGFTVINKDNK
ncbi:MULTISPECIES: 4'-phosphopantetheinyl transferase family protein [Bacillus]|uniref:4'-phosphopantetheinyl transferase family protein n=1 Tax=Bacillus TaxID=1386 RepID=UPI0023DC4EEE|nr:4'-phosphopantetheinyl transferase superfamily protein [Bacillus pseudomycoides]MDF2086167.1 4'-phosphopantetheinyl transferase superfamily protein [Bacillus pseudomycoides]